MLLCTCILPTRTSAAAERAACKWSCKSQRKKHFCEYNSKPDLLCKSFAGPAIFTGTPLSTSSGLLAYTLLTQYVVYPAVHQNLYKVTICMKAYVEHSSTPTILGSSFVYGATSMRQHSIYNSRKDYTGISHPGSCISGTSNWQSLGNGACRNYLHSLGVEPHIILWLKTAHVLQQSRCKRLQDAIIWLLIPSRDHNHVVLLPWDSLHAHSKMLPPYPRTCTTAAKHKAIRPTQCSLEGHVMWADTPLLEITTTHSLFSHGQKLHVI